MKLLHKQLLMVIATVTGTFLNAGYEYDFVNMIGDPIVLKINQSRVDTQDIYQIIFPGQTVKQVFNNVYCLEKLAWAPYAAVHAYTKEPIPYKGGLDLVDKQTGRIPDDKQREFGDIVARFYAPSSIKIKLESNEEYQKTVAYAEKLLEGGDAFVCQTITEVKDFMKLGAGLPTGTGTGMGMGGNIGSGNTFNFGGGGTGGGAGDINTKKLIALLGDIADILDVDYTTKTPAEKEAAIAKLKTLTSGDNLNLLQNVGKISLLDIVKLREALKNADLTREALAILEREAKKLAPTKIDTDAFIMRTSMNTGAPASKCSFGLATIGRAAGELKGGTLCKSRTFIIYYEVDADGLPKLDPKTSGPLAGRPLLEATTRIGE